MVKVEWGETVCRGREGGNEGEERGRVAVELRGRGGSRGRMREGAKGDARKVGIRGGKPEVE